MLGFTKRHMVKILASLCILAAGSLLVFGMRRDGADDLAQLSINGQSITAERAVTPTQREQGLSGRESLASDHGMLFVFEASGQHGIWMKGMRFPIDVLWLDASGRVIYVVNNMSPASYPHSYQPPLPARYVLELDDKTIERFKIDTQTQVQGL